MNTVLVIDDDASVRESFALALLSRDCTVVTAANGGEGLQCAMARRPHLVFLDLRMPGMDCVEVLRTVQPQVPEARIYIATAYRRDYLEPLRAAATDGFRFEVLEKPLVREKIRAVFDAVFEGNQIL